MTRFHFHICTGTETVRDEEGEDLPDIEAAASEAILCARDYVCQHLKAGHPLDFGGQVLIEEAGRQGYTSMSFVVAMQAKLG